MFKQSKHACLGIDKRHKSRVCRSALGFNYFVGDELAIDPALARTLRPVSG